MSGQSKARGVAWQTVCKCMVILRDLPLKCIVWIGNIMSLVLTGKQCKVKAKIESCLGIIMKASVALQGKSTT